MRKELKGVSWREQVKGWEESGLSGVQYAGRQGLSVGVLYAWKHRLKVQTEAAARADRPAKALPKRDRKGAAAEFRFVPARVMESSVEAEGSSVEVVLSNGRIVWVRGRVDSEVLEQTLRAAEAVDR